MKASFVLVEGESDKMLLASLISSNLLEKTEFVVAGGKSPALSIGRSLLVRFQKPVALVLDSDSWSQEESLGQSRELGRLLQQASRTVKSAVFLAIPCLEALILRDRSVVAHAAGREVGDAEWTQILMSPKDTIQRLFRGRKPEWALPEAMLSVIREDKMISNLNRFLSGDDSPTRSWIES